MKRIKNFLVYKSNSGQIVLVLVLITVVGLTIGLSLISRTITDVRISSQIEQSGRAFSAAEAGIETALRANINVGPTGSVTLPGAQANYSVTIQGGSSDSYNLPFTQVNGSQNVWLVEHNSDGTLNLSGYSYPVSSTFDICWGSPSSVDSAILLTLIYRIGTRYSLVKMPFDSISRGNNFVLADILGNYCNGNYKYKVTVIPGTDTNSNTDDLGISGTATLILLRLQVLYSATAISVLPTSVLPSQGIIINSVGQTDTGVVRKIQVSQGYATLPTLLDFSLYSEN